MSTQTYAIAYTNNLPAGSSLGSIQALVNSQPEAYTVVCSARTLINAVRRLKKETKLVPALEAANVAFILETPSMTAYSSTGASANGNAPANVYRNGVAARRQQIMQELTFGFELEVEGPMTRYNVAQAIRRVVGGRIDNMGGTARSQGNQYSVIARDGRTWKCMRDGSLAGDGGCEVVSPVCKAVDFPLILKVVEAVKNAGATVSGRCGLHCHVGASHLTVDQLRNLVKVFNRFEELCFQAIGTQPHRLDRWCRKNNPKFVSDLDEKRPRSKDEFGQLYYGADGARLEYERTGHYSQSRYKALNLHNLFNGEKGTVEYRFGEATLDGEEVLAFVTLCLAMTAIGVEVEQTVSTKWTPENAKAFMRSALKYLGVTGETFGFAAARLLSRLPESGI